MNDIRNQLKGAIKLASAFGVLPPAGLLGVHLVEGSHWTVPGWLYLVLYLIIAVVVGLIVTGIVLITRELRGTPPSKTRRPDRKQASPEPDFRELANVYPIHSIRPQARAQEI